MPTQSLPDIRLDAVLTFIKAREQIAASNVRALFSLRRSQDVSVGRSWEQQGKIIGQCRGRGAHYVLPGTGLDGSTGLRSDGGGRLSARDGATAGSQGTVGHPARLQFALKTTVEACRVISAEYARAEKGRCRSATRIGT